MMVTRVDASNRDGPFQNRARDCARRKGLNVPGLLHRIWSGRLALVDADGNIAGRFEGVISQQEVAALLETV